MLGERNTLETGIIILTYEPGDPSQRYVRASKSVLSLPHQNILPKGSLGYNKIYSQDKGKNIIFVHKKAEASSKLL